MNFTYSTDGLPLGWDTPYYVWKIHSAVSLGTAGFISGERYYHILYPTVGGWISGLGVDAFSIEKVLPPFMWVAGFLAIIAIAVRETRDWNAVMVATATSSTWFGFLRLASDLHATLLSLVLMLVATLLFLRMQGTSDRQLFLFELLILGTLVLGSSFAHVEVTLFILSIWVLALSLRYWRRLIGTRRYLSIVLTTFLSIVPGLVIYWNQFQAATSPLGGRLPSISTMAPIVWVAYIGPVGLVALVALLAMYRSIGQLWRSSPLATLTTSWLVLTLAIGLVQYLEPRLTPFSERAVILAPTPFLATIIIPRLNMLRTTSSQRKGLVLVTLVITGGMAFYNALVGPYYYNSFISDSAAVALRSIRSNGLVDTRNTIFIFNAAAPFAGGLAEHDNYWVYAFIGDHFAYLGRIDFLLAGVEARFLDDSSRLISDRFFSQLSLEQISSLSVVYVEDFNVPNPIPSYYLDFLTPIAPGAYLVNRTYWGAQHQVLIPAFSSTLSSTTGWHSEVQDWTRSGWALKVFSKKPGQQESASIAFVAPRNAEYTVSLRFWDTAIPSNRISILVDGREVHQLSYNGTLSAVNTNIFSGSLDSGVHILTLNVDDNPNQAQFMSVDYISIGSR